MSTTCFEKSDRASSSPALSPAQLSSPALPVVAQTKETPWNLKTCYIGGVFGVS